MNVLHVIGSLDQRLGGPIRVALDLSAASRALGVHNELLSVGEIRIADNPLGPGLLHSVSTGIPNRYGYAPQLAQWLRTNIQRFDCVILHGMWQFPGLAAARACRGSGVPYAIFPHGMLEPWSIQKQGRWKYLKKAVYWALFERRVFQRASYALFTTKRELDQARKVFRFTCPALVVAPYGVTKPGRPEQDVDGVVPELDGRKFLLFLGRIHPHKNIPLLIRAWAKTMLNSEWKLAIVGPSDGHYRREMEKLATELCGSGKCVFLDFAAGARKHWLLSNARWFALPSQHENFGIALFEALAHGCPVVASDQVYSGEFLEPQGRILPLIEEQWAKFFQARLEDDDYRNLVIASDSAVAGRYSMDKAAVKWVELLRGIAKKSSHAQIRVA